MAHAGPVPAPAAAGVPLSILVDFDGTVAVPDITDVLLVEHANDPAWRAADDAYAARQVGSRTLLAWDATIIGRDRGLLERTALSQPADPTFVPFVIEMRRLGALVEVVSDGLGFYVEPFLDRIGAGDVPVATSRLDFEATPFRLDFPYGHPACFVCGTCKRERVRAHQAAGRFVVFVGDGESDRYAAWHADLVFAKLRLAEVCRAEGWVWRPWERFSDVSGEIGDGLKSGELPATIDDLARVRARPSHASRASHASRDGFICGPEAWGEGRVAPAS